MSEESLSKPSVALHPNFLFAVRLVISLTWLYEGLWQKVIIQDAHELSIVSQFAAAPETAHGFMMLIGIGETLLAIGVLSGVLHRALAWLQIVLLVSMNGLGIIFGGGAIQHPVALIIHNLPLVACIVLVGWYGPGAYALKSWRPTTS